MRSLLSLLLSPPAFLLRLLCEWSFINSRYLWVWDPLGFSLAPAWVTEKLKEFCFGANENSLSPS